MHARESKKGTPMEFDHGLCAGLRVAIAVLSNVDVA
jgi:hypothetical protein